MGRMKDKQIELMNGDHRCSKCGVPVIENNELLLVFSVLTAGDGSDILVCEKCAPCNRHEKNYFAGIDD